jgi:hypothetical protein
LPASSSRIPTARHCALAASSLTSAAATVPPPSTSTGTAAGRATSGMNLPSFHARYAMRLPPMMSTSSTGVSK